VKTFLVTGATGVVGSAIVERLLAVPGTSVVLLVRARSADELAAKRAALADYWREAPVPLSPATLAERVRWVTGDTSRAGLGLDDADRATIVRTCTHLVHCAGEVRMNLTIEDARRSAGVGLAGIVDLARAIDADGRLAKLDVVSTVGVAGRLPGVLPERWIDTPRAFHNTYEQAKAEAEDRLREAAATLPVTVHRPSMVVGEAASGRVLRFQVFYHLAEFLSGVRTRGLFPPIGAGALDLVPVDYVADAIVWSALHPAASRGRVLHLSAGADGALPLPVIRDTVRAAFARAGIATPTPRTLPAPVFRTALALVARAVGERERRALGTLPVFLDYLASDQRFGNGSTRALLAPHGIVLPPMSEALAPILERYLATRRGKPRA
jgi:thioester reductase-like protein